ncbi:MAG: hypothetical protein IH612_15665, partial [Desulfofustis sp.]|nr:hypothetical protein [Desulfofustis sp.]
MRFLLYGLIGVMLLFPGLSVAQTEQQQPVRTVALLPFAAEQAGSFAYLDAAIRQMLTTRLAGRKGIEVYTPEISDRQAGLIRDLLQKGDFVQAAQQLPVDWLAAGEIVADQDGVRVNLTLFPLQDTGDQQPLGFTSTDVDAILPAVAQLAEAVGDRVLIRQEVDTVSQEQPTP